VLLGQNSCLVFISCRFRPIFKLIIKKGTFFIDLSKGFGRFSCRFGLLGTYWILGRSVIAFDLVLLVCRLFVRRFGLLVFVLSSWLKICCICVSSLLYLLINLHCLCKQSFIQGKFPLYQTQLVVNNLY
jgi:hypothetical protein